MAGVFTHLGDVEPHFTSFPSHSATPRSYFKCIEVLNYFDHFDSEETDAGMIVAAVFVVGFVDGNHFRTLKWVEPRNFATFVNSACLNLFFLIVVLG